MKFTVVIKHGDSLQYCMKLWCTNIPSSRHGGHLSSNLEQVS